MTRQSVSLFIVLLLPLLALAQTSSDSVTITFRTHAASSPVQYVPGQFNNWGPNSGGTISPGAPSQMAYDAGLAAWLKTYTFKIHDPARTPLGDSVYQYKFNAGGSTWYSDPLNPEQNPADHNNSVLRLTRLFWFEYYPTLSSGNVTRITAGLVHANSDTVRQIIFSTGQTQSSSLTRLDVTSSYSEASRILDFPVTSTVLQSDYVRLVAYNNHGDSVVFARGGYAVAHVPLPGYAQHGVTLPSIASHDSTTFRLRVPGKDFVLLHVAPLGQSPSLAPAVLMHKNPSTSDWWVNLKLDANTTYEYLYELENSQLITDPWGRWNGTNGSRFSTGPEGLTADNYVWQATGFVRPPLNKIVIYELNVGEFAGGYYGLSAGQAGFRHLAALMPHFDSLGVNAIELMPVNDYSTVGQSGFSWGYDLNSDFALEPAYGTPAEFKALVDSAHQHGIAVIVDLVYNHINDTSPLWRMLPDEAANPYIKRGDDLRYNEDGLLFFKDLDHWTAETQELVYTALKMWIDTYHVDGFRYDYTQGIGWNTSEPTKGILGWANRIDQEYNGTIYQIAEHLPESPALIYYSGLTSGWHDSFHDRIFEQGYNPNVSLADMENLVVGLGAFPSNDTPASPSTYGSRVEPVNATVNHDEQSIIYELKTYQGVPESLAIKRDKLYATYMFTSLGIPMLWQGMEYGEPRGWRNDGEKLAYRPVQWSRAATAEGQTHYAYYHALIRQRRLNPALTRGRLRTLWRYDSQKTHVWGFEDTVTAAKVMAVANLSGNQQTVRNVPWLATGEWYNVFDGSVFNAAGTTLDSLTVPSYTALVYSSIRDTVLLPVREDGPSAPTDCALGQNWPNPWNPATMINYTIGEGGKDVGTMGGGDLGRNVLVQLTVYDILGREVKTLVRETQRPGSYQVRFDADGLASGVYLYRLSAGSFVQTKRMLLLK